MKKITLLLSLTLLLPACISCATSRQSGAVKRTFISDEGIIVEEIPAVFRKDQSFSGWVSRNIWWDSPELLKIVRSGVSGEVVATFSLDADGVIRQVDILSSPHELFSDEVRKVILRSPKWRHPCTHNGIPVQSPFTLPVNFRLR